MIRIEIECKGVREQKPEKMKTKQINMTGCMHLFILEHNENAHSIDYQLTHSLS